MKPWLECLSPQGDIKLRSGTFGLHPEAIYTKGKDRLWLCFGKKNGKIGHLSCGIVKNKNKGQNFRCFLTPTEKEKDHKIKMHFRCFSESMNKKNMNICDTH